MALQPSLSWWNELSKSQKVYVTNVSDLILSTKVLDENTIKMYDGLVASENIKDEFNRSIAFARAVMSTMTMFAALRSLGNRLYCYHKSDEKKRVEIKAIISESSKHPQGVIILEGNIPSYTAPLAIKWYRGDRFTIDHEIRLYNEMYSVNKDVLPWFSANYSLWNDPVLVIRAKKILDDDDHEIDVGLAILNKLKWIHSVCIHCDIKPSNIVKDEVNGKKRYYLIDFGQSTPIEERQGDHHIRYVHTKDYCRPGYKNKTTIKTDFVELLHTLRKIQLKRLGQSGSHLSGYHGELRQYQKVLEHSPEYPDDDIYERLAATLRR